MKAIHCLFTLAALLSAGCQPVGSDSVSSDLVASKLHSARVYSGASFEERVAAGVEKASSAAISEEALKRITRYAHGAHAKADGTVAVDNPDKLVGFVPDSKQPVKLKGLFADQFTNALHGTDEQAAAKLLAESGVGVVIVHDSVKLSTDRSKRIYSQLVHHGHLEYFSLFRVTNGLLMYKVQPDGNSFRKELAAAGMQYLRERFAGTRAPGSFRVPPRNGGWTLVGVLRGQGHELATSLAQNPTFNGALEELIRDLERQHRRGPELDGFPPLKEHIAELKVELHLVTERAYVEPRDKEFLEQLWEPGLDGAYILAANKKKRGTLAGGEAYAQSIKSADQFLRRLAIRKDLGSLRPWRDSDTWLELFRTKGFLSDPKHGLIPLYRGAPPLPLAAVGLDTVKAGIIAGGEWYLSNLKPNGQVTYKVWPSENRYSNEYNFVRHTLATWNLVQAYELDPRPEFLAGAKLALDYTNSKLKRGDVTEACKKVRWCDVERLDVTGQMAFYEARNNRKLGSVVVAMMGLIDYVKVTGDKSYDEQLREMGRFVKFMQLDSGTFEGYYVEPDHSYYGQRNDIVPGEAALAMVMLAEYLDDDLWISGLPAFWSYYQPWFAERVERRLAGRPVPMLAYTNNDRLELVQFGPWTVMAANAYHARTGDTKVAEFGFAIAEWMIDTYGWMPDNTPYPDYLGGYYKMPFELPAMQAFCYSEGTAAAYAMAARMKHPKRAYFEEATRASVRFALLMQYNQLNTYPFSRPNELIGGIRYAMNETKVRIDYVYHGQSTLVQWYHAAKNDPDLPDPVKTAPAFPWQLNEVPPKPEFLKLAAAGE